MIEIGSGLGIDEITGEMIVIDHSRAERALARSADSCDRAVFLMATGDVAGAAAELDKAPASLRRDALRGELARISGNPDQAVAILNDILQRSEAVGLRRATLLQHLGKAEHALGQQHAAMQHLEQALRLRVQAEAPADQIASSRLMLTLVRRHWSS